MSLSYTISLSSAERFNTHNKFVHFFSGPCIGMSCHNYTKTTMEAAAAALDAQIDINSGGFMRRENPLTGYAYEHLNEALSAGLISEAQLDRALARIFQMRIRLGLLDPPELNPWSAINASTVDSAPHRALALKSAVEGTVLLKNSRSILPLDITSLSKGVAIIGPLADSKEALLGNYNGCSVSRNGSIVLANCTLITPLAGISAAVKSHGVSVTYNKGCDVESADASRIAAAVTAARSASVAIVVVGLMASAGFSNIKTQVLCLVCS